MMVGLEDNGAEYLFDIFDQYENSESLKEGRIVSRMPTYLPEYGDIYRGDSDLVVKYLSTENQLTGAMQRYFDEPHNQNMHEIRVWVEMAYRDEEFMPELVAWADDFSWVVMEEAEEYGDTREIEDDLLDAGWAPFDIEIGVFDDQPRVIDAGFLARPEEDWNVEFSELSDHPRAFSR